MAEEETKKLIRVTRQDLHQGVGSVTIIRDPVAVDERAWRHLWAGYIGFYEAKIPDAVTTRTWQRILDPNSNIFCRLAVTDNLTAGFSISVLHEGTWTVTPICYLEDLFVELKFRGKGIGRLLIQDLVDRARASGWSRIYWHTRASNPARRLYDKFVQADDFVRYRMLLT
jgi:GNAT superfamily N-acetyltransferase